LNAIGKSTAEMTAIKICESKPLEPAQILTSSQRNQHLVEDKNQCLYQDCPLENLCVLCVKQKTLLRRRSRPRHCRISREDRENFQEGSARKVTLKSHLKRREKRAKDTKDTDSAPELVSFVALSKIA
jgi:hypothetical protein